MIARRRVASALSFSIAAFVFGAAGCAREHTFGPSYSAGKDPACARLEPDRARIRVLLGEGKLDRALRLAQRVEGACAEDAELTWADHVTALAAIGRGSEARQLADRIDASSRSTAKDRAAASAARNAVADRDAAPRPSERADEEARRELRRALDAARANDPKEAKAHALASWKARHPNPRALVEAGLAAAALGDRAEAQRLWDRAAYDDPNTPVRPEIVLAPTFESRSAVVAIAQHGDLVAAAGGSRLRVLDGALHLRLALSTGEDRVTALAFTPDGSEVIAGTSSGQVRSFDVSTGDARQLATGGGAVLAMLPSPDGRKLAIARADSSIAILDLTSGAPLFASHIEHSGDDRGASHLAWSPRGESIAWATEGGFVGLIDASNGKNRRLASVHGKVLAIGFSMHELDVVTRDEHLRADVGDGGSRAQSASFKTIERNVHLGAAASTTTGFATAASDDVRLPASSGSIARPASASEAPESTTLAATPDGRFVVAALGDRTLRLVQEGRVTDLTTAPPVTSIAVGRGGHAIASGAADGSVRVVSIDGGPVATLHAKGKAARVAASGGMLAFGGDAGAVTLIDAHGNAVEFALGGPVLALAFSPDGSRIAAAGKPSRIHLADAHTGLGAHDFELEAGDVTDLSFSPGGEKLLSASSKGLTLWDLATSKGERYTAFGAAPRAVAWASDRSAFAVARSDSTLAIGAPGHPSPDAVVHLLGSAVAVAFGGSTIALAEADGSISLRSPPEKITARLRGSSPARAMAVLSGGIAAGAIDGSIRLFSTDRAREVAAVLPTPTGAIAVAPDGHLEPLGGGAAEGVVCRLGPFAYPWEVCAEPFLVRGLLAMALAGRDPAEADP